MGDSLFQIFGDHIVKKNAKNIIRQPLSNVENMGKLKSAGPVKPNEPAKKVGPVKMEAKKSFFSNKGMALQSTPIQTPFKSRLVNLGSLIYSDPRPKQEQAFDFNEIEFTMPASKFDNYHEDVIDCLPIEQFSLSPESPPTSPSPVTMKYEMELHSSSDDIFTDDYSNEEIAFDDLGLPDLS